MSTTGNNSQELAPLRQMLDDFDRAPALYHPSPFWRELVADHIQQLEDWGIGQFKRTVGRRYFHWGLMGIFAHQFSAVAWHWLRHPDASVFTAELPDYDRPRGAGIVTLNPVAAWFYKVYVAMLARLVWQQDREGLCRTIEEPAVGNPLRVRFCDRWVSQDLCNSVHEFYSAWRSDPRDSHARIAELGAGYGRLAYVFLKALPSSSYTIIDIPPALYVAQEYLKATFPGEKVFHYRPFESYAEVQEEFESSRIRFLMAHQIELLPPKQFDLFMNISSLHEMTREQITLYLQQVHRLCCGRFYTKQWRTSRSPQNQFVIREHEYPIPASWQLLTHRRHPIQRWFFEALYEVR